MINQPKQGKVLYMYLSVLGIALSSVLIRKEAGTQAPMYYTSRAFWGAEEKYSRGEKMAFALVITAQQLRPYFQAHTIWVLMDQPLMTILHKPETLRRLVKWSMELSKFDIEYCP